MGHSFEQADEEVVGTFLKYFDRLKDQDGFTWDHAEYAKPKVLYEKVCKKMLDKNLFIGICTIKERVISPSKLKKRWLRESVYANLYDFEFKTSDWIIQEIGYALGSGINVILLLEEGLREPGGLQGDLEYITFNREVPEKSFIKILEMISGLKPTKITEESERIAQPILKKDKKEEEKDEEIKMEPDENWKRSDYFKALYQAIINNDEKKEEEISESYLSTDYGKQAEAKIDLKLDRLFIRLFHQKEINLQEVQKLLKEHPSNVGIHSLLGNIYNKYEQYEKSAEYYLKAARLSSDNLQKLQKLSSAAVAFSKIGNESKKESALDQAKDILYNMEDGETELLKALIEISKIENDNVHYLAFYEGLLDCNPDDHSHRFDLAFKYSEVDEYDLSLYHYKMLIKNKPDDLEYIWNNTGWALQQLNLPGKAVEAYQESKKSNNTLAMSNLADMALKAGFVDLAEEICNKAIEFKDCNPRIPKILSQLKSLREDESIKEQKLLEKTQRLRLFYIDYAHACTKKLTSDIQGIWKGLKFDLTIEIKDGYFQAKGSYEKNLLAGLLREASGGHTSRDTTSKMSVLYQGSIFGLGIKFKQTIKEENHTTLPFPKSDVTNEGLMIISEDLTKIKVYQKGDRDNEKFYVLRRKKNKS